MLSALNVRKSAVLDDILASLLKLCAPAIVCSLACLFNRTFELSEFPQVWKDALIYKIGAPSDPLNFRPIALLPIVGKILERIVHNKLSVFLRPRLTKNQSGFRKGDGTVPQLLRLTQIWSENIDKSFYVEAFFFFFFFF